MTLNDVRYCIDTSCFVNMVKNQPIDLFPGLWGNLQSMVEQRTLLIHRMVREEVLVKDDEAAAWIKQIPLDLLVEIDGDQTAFITRMSSEWKHLAHLYQQPAYEKKADPFLIAMAAVYGYYVVTDEGPKEWHIPDICSRYDISVLKLLPFIRKMNWSFK